MSARKAKPAAKRASAPDINDAIRAIQKVEAVVACVHYAANEELEDVDYSDALALIAESLASALLTLDAVEANIGREVSDERK